MILDTSDEAFNRRVACNIIGEKFQEIESGLNYRIQSVLYELSSDDLQKSKVIHELEMSYDRLRELETTLKLAEEVLDHFVKKQVND